MKISNLSSIRKDHLVSVTFERKMGKKIVAMSGKTKKTNEEILARIKQNLGLKWSCCVLITCTEPEKNGKMEVEMHFDGDENVAAFLVDNASQVFEERFLLSETK